MKKYLILALNFVALFILSVSTADAHSGRTDASGGHNCSQKSINKGLCTGYHNHNGGSSSGSVSAQPSYNPKVYYDNGYNGGYKKGYQMGYDRESSVASSDDSNVDYAEGWTAGYQKGLEEGLAKIQKEEQDAKEKLDGAEKGTSDGVSAFSDGKKKDEYGFATGSSEIYINAYKVAYSSAWGLASSKKVAYDKGYEQGISQDEVIIPNEFQKEPLNVEFENGHKAGVDERDKQEKERYKSEGYKLGYEVLELAIPVDVKKDIYTNAFKKGYEEGLGKREDEITAEGFDYAFKELNYKDPNTHKNNSKFLEWFIVGFNSNKVAEEIKEKAIELGKEKDEYYIPKKYKVNEDAINLYDGLFEKGQKIKAEKERKTRNTIIVSSAVGAPAIGGLFFFMKRRKRNIG